MKIRVGERSGPSDCPLCQTAIASEAPRTCPECVIDYHAACLVELGSCVTPGCDWGADQPLRFNPGEPVEVDPHPRSAVWPMFAACAAALVVVVFLLWTGMEPELAAPLGFMAWLLGLYLFENQLS